MSDVRIGLVGYAAPTGLGYEYHRTWRCLPGCARWLMVPHPDLGWAGADMDERCDGTVYAVGDSPRIQRWNGSDEQIADFLNAVDILFAVERTVPPDLFERAHRHGVRCVLAVNAEWFVPDRPWIRAADTFVVRTRQADELVRAQAGTIPVTYVPCPLDLEELPSTPRTSVQRMMFSNGWGGVHDRKGWPEIAGLLAADPTLPLTVRSQRPMVLADPLPATVRVLGACADPADVYTGFDLAVQPSRFEGVGLAILEPMACGLPVITTDAPPMRDYVQAAYGLEIAERLLVPADRSDVQIWNRPVPAYRARVPELLERIRWWQGRDCTVVSAAGRTYVEREHGPAIWQRLAEVITNDA